MKNQPSSGPKRTRRGFLQGIAGAAVASMVGSAVSADQKQTISPAPEKALPPQTTSTVPETHEHQEEKKLSPALDVGTALGVFAPFAVHVLYKGAINEENLSWNSIRDVNGAAVARMTALSLLGGKEGKDVAAEELHEIAEGLMPVPALLLLSDATTSQLKVDVEAIFRKAEKEILTQPGYKNIQRPSLNSTPVEWEKYLEGTNNNLIEKVAQISGLCAAFAPLGTTYTSSALANELKKDVARMLYEQSYAQTVLRYKAAQPNASLGSAFIESVAVERANKLLNGPLGFSNLMVTLSANIQGTCLLGDPPEVYFLKKHHKRPLRIAKSTAFGAANAEVFTMLLNSWWLKQANVPQKGYKRKFFSAQAKALKSIGEVATNSKTASVSLNNGRGFAKKLRKTLERKAKQSNGKIARETLELLNNIPEAKLQFSFRDYIGSKMKIAQRWINTPADLPEDEVFANAESFANDDFIHKLHLEFATTLKAGQEKDASRTLKKIMSALEGAQAKIQNVQADNLAKLLNQLAEDKNLNPELLENYADMKEQAAAVKTEVSAQFDEPLDQETEAKLDRILKIMETIDKDFSDVNGKSKIEQLQEALKILSRDDQGAAPYRTDEEKHTNAKEIFKILAVPDKETYDKAIKDLTEIKPEQEQSADNSEASSHEGVDEIRKKTNVEHHTSFLSHSAQEVFFALLTQIPSVPALARLAEKIIPQMVGIANGQKPTLNQLKAIIFLTLTLTALLSAFADNVAAYMFGEKILSKFFQDAYGEKIFEEQPEILDMISIAALKVAENAGNLSKIGNGPNLSQKKIAIELDKNSPQGIKLHESDLKMKETLLHKNGFSAAANITSIATYGTLVMKKMSGIDAPLANDTGQSLKVAA